MTAKAVRVAPVAVVLSLIAMLCAAAESSALIERAKAMIGRGEYEQVVALLAPAVADRGRTPLERARAMTLLTDARIALGDLDTPAREADAIDGEAARPELRCAAEYARASLAEARSDVPAETAHYLKTLEWADRSGQPRLIGDAVDWVAHVYGAQSLDDKRLALLDSRLAAARPDDPNRAEYLVLRANSLTGVRDVAGAKRALDEAQPLAERNGDAWELAELHLARGLIAWRIERDRPRALADYEQALAYSRRGGSISQMAFVYNAIGNVYRGSARDDRRFLTDALKAYTQGAEWARRAQLPSSSATLLKNIGEIHRMMGDTDGAARVLAEAIDVADRGNVTQIRWMARMYVAMSMRDRDAAGAERRFGEAVDVLEAEANKMALGDLHAGLLAAEITTAENPYEQFIEFLLDGNHPDRAFFVAERQRARVLLDALAAGSDTVMRDAPAAFSTSERDLLARIKTAQAALRAGALSDAKRQELVGLVDRSETALTGLRLRLAIDRPALARARYPRLLTIAEVQSTLLYADEALVSFYLGADQSVAWVATKDQLTAIRLPARKTIEDAVRAALQQLRDPAGSNGAALATLARTLSISDVAKLAAAKRLVIVPDGILFDVPFEALPDAAGHPIVERYAVSYAPSASTLALLRSSAPHDAAAPTLVAVANPVVSGAPLTGTRQVDLPHLNLLSPLPSTSGEAKQIARLFGSHAIVLDGAQANAAALGTAGIEHARVLHFATHGLIDEERPERSGLVLTANPPRDDGLLQTRDIYRLRLDADLVTLSACETALGQNVTGEGMIGLTRAFFYAGARAVVASLWDVEDAATARLMEEFYRNIRRGDPIDIALQQAKLSFVKSGGGAGRPFVWASFIVNGQARAIVDVPRSNFLATVWGSLAALGTAVSVVALAMVWVRARRRR